MREIKTVSDLYYKIVCSYHGTSKKWRRRRIKKGLRLLADFNKECKEKLKQLGLDK